MDNPESPSPIRSWAPAIRLVVAGWIASAAAGTWCVLGADPQGRLLAGIAAAALAAVSLYGTLARPRLAADHDGIVVSGMFSRRRWPWSAVQQATVTKHRRLGRDLPTLELDIVDADDVATLVVLARLELDADPRDVLDELTAIRP